MKIDKNIPIPNTTGRGRRGYQKYKAFRSMDVGDSVFVDGQDSQGKAMTAARSYGQRCGKSFASRKENSGVRIWRIG